MLKLRDVLIIQYENEENSRSKSVMQCHRVVNGRGKRRKYWKEEGKFSPMHAMKLYRGSRGIVRVFLNPYTEWSLVASFTLRLLKPRSKRARYSLDGRPIGPRASLYVLYHRINS
jgi:hypothetical protein